MKTKYKCLYEITGRIEDVATFLVPIADLSKQEQGEPVAWMDEFGNVFPLGAQLGPKWLREPMMPLYTTPPAAQRQWVGLTLQERNELCRAVAASTHQVRAIEAKLRSKNI